MSRLIRETSREAFRHLLEDNELTRMQGLVMGALIELGGRATNRQIANHLKIAINRVTGRTRGLYLKGKIAEDVQVKNPKSGCLNWRWKIVK